MSMLIVVFKDCAISFDYTRNLLKLECSLAVYYVTLDNKTTVTVDFVYIGSIIFLQIANTQQRPRRLLLLEP